MWLMVAKSILIPGDCLTLLRHASVFINDRSLHFASRPFFATLLPMLRYVLSLNLLYLKLPPWLWPSGMTTSDKLTSDRLRCCIVNWEHRDHADLRIGAIFIFVVPCFGTGVLCDTVLLVPLHL